MSDEGTKVIRELLRRFGEVDHLEDAAGEFPKLLAALDRELSLPKWSAKERAEIEAARRDVERARDLLATLPPDPDRPASCN